MNLPNMYSFTFYYIYIKTTSKTIITISERTFTFYYIYIKTSRLFKFIYCNIIYILLYLY